MTLSRFVRRDLDLSLISTLCVLTLLGIIMIYSATYNWDQDIAGRIYEKQIVWSLIAIIGLILTLAIPLKFYYAFAYIIYGIFILFLLLVLEFGDRRWFNFGPINVQPSELAKIATVLVLARYLSVRNLNLERVRTFSIPLFLVLLPGLLVYKQPDLGTALVFSSILFPMLFWAGMHPINLFLIISPVISIICAFHYLSLAIFILLFIGIIFWRRPRLTTTLTLMFINLTVAVGAPKFWNHRLHDYQRKRILTFLHPDIDKLGAGYQVIQSKVAIGSGGLKGKGLLQGTQTKLAFLPEQHTDFIFSVVGEEFGFLGAITVLVLFTFMVWRAIQIAVQVKSRFSSLVAVGLASILIFHIFVNIGMTIGVMPVTGLPLPFLSYGGSPLVMCVALVGFLLNINARRHEYY